MENHRTWSGYFGQCEWSCAWGNSSPQLIEKGGRPSVGSRPWSTTELAVIYYNTKWIAMHYHPYREIFSQWCCIPKRRADLTRRFFILLDELDVFVKMLALFKNLKGWIFFYVERICWICRSDVSHRTGGRTSPPHLDSSCGRCLENFPPLPQLRCRNRYATAQGLITPVGKPITLLYCTRGSVAANHVPLIFFDLEKVIVSLAVSGTRQSPGIASSADGHRLPRNDIFLI